MKLNEIYTVQSYLEERIVKEKMSNKDYVITVTLVEDDDNMVPILVDGNHNLEAAKRNNAIDKIEIVIVENEAEKTLERYVESFNDLSNPVNIITGRELW